MTTDEQKTMDGLSQSVTALALAIDPDCTHGPETEKLAAYAATTRRLAEELANGVFTGNRAFQANKAREILEHLGATQRLNGGIRLAPGTGQFAYLSCPE